MRCASSQLSVCEGAEPSARMNVLGEQVSHPIPDNLSSWWTTGKTTISCGGVCDQQTYTSMAAIAASRANHWAYSAEWRSAVDASSCVATQYAQTSHEEAFGQAAVFNLFEHHKGHYPGLETADDVGDWSLMAPQFAYLDTLTIFSFNLLANSCAVGPAAPQSLPPADPTALTEWKGGYFTLTVASGSVPKRTPGRCRLLLWQRL